MSLQERYETVVKEVSAKGLENDLRFRHMVGDLHTCYRYYGHSDTRYNVLTISKKIDEINAAIKAVGGN